MVAAANAGVKAPALETKFDRFASEEIVDTTEPGKYCTPVLYS